MNNALSKKDLSYTHFSKIMIENRNISTNTSFDVDNNLSNPYQFQKEERQNNWGFFSPIGFIPSDLLPSANDDSKTFSYLKRFCRIRAELPFHEYRLSLNEVETNFAILNKVIH